MTARILIADGSATSRIMLKVRLGAACYDVTTVSTIQELQQSLQKHRSELVILGAALTDSDQVSACRLISQNHPGMTILALAAASTRIHMLRAGATAVLDSQVNEQMLLARIRCLLREDDQGSGYLFSMAEAPAAFDDTWTGSIMLIADSPARALGWRHVLQAQLSCRLSVSTPEEALSHVASGKHPDLYLISANIKDNDDGLRLMSELRSRQGSRDAAFVIATDTKREDIATFALDLGAGDILPLDLSEPNGIEAATLTLENQLARKRRADRRRDAERRSHLWAIIDPLTGLYNRRYAHKQLSEIIDTAILQAKSFAVLILDLDHFKSINDSYGHAAGDAVLCEIARRLQTVVGDRGLTARLGGEEFLIALPQTDEWQAHRVAEEIRQTVGLRSILLPRLSGGREIAVTISVGIAVDEASGPRNNPHQLAELVLERADQALMAAKSRGRNRVMLAPNEVWMRA